MTDYASANGALATSANVEKWKMVYQPALKQLVIAVPTTVADSGGQGVRTHKVTASTWLVMNTETGAWNTFSGLFVMDAIPYSRNILFVDGSSSVMAYGPDCLSNGSSFTFEVRQAYNYLNAPTNKLATMVQPLMMVIGTQGDFKLTVQVDADYTNGTISSYATPTFTSSSPFQPKYSPARIGMALAIHMAGTATSSSLNWPLANWYATNWLYVPAGIV
jgi:hypothetical protein